MKRIFIYYSHSGNGDKIANYLMTKGIDIRKVMALTPKDKQIALFSATMPREIQNITWEFMQDAAEIDVMPSKTQF